MELNLIVAFCKNRGIGMNNQLPWNIPEDLKRFSKLTKGILSTKKDNGKTNTNANTNANTNNPTSFTHKNALIMGKNTWTSLPKKPLPKRDHLILSTSLQIDTIDSSGNNEIMKTFSSIDDCISFCKLKQYHKVWVIGGASIYNQFIEKNIIDNMYITYIDKEYHCDTFFPPIKGPFVLYGKHLLSSENKIWCPVSKVYYINRLYKRVYPKDVLFYKKNNKELAVMVTSIVKNKDGTCKYIIRYGDYNFVTTSDKLTYV